MAKIRSGLAKITGHSEYRLPLDGEIINGSEVDIFTFPKYIKRYKQQFFYNGEKFSRLNSPQIENLSEEHIKEIQWQLLKNQIDFAFATTPAINYIWKEIYKISPEKINCWDDFESIPPITKKHQRLFGWINFLPAPIADFYIDGLSNDESIDDVNSNLMIEKRKYTGGTTAKEGSDYILIVIPKADWRASVDTMERLLLPIEHAVKSISIAATPYIRVHIAEEIFESQLGRYGKHIISKPAGANDTAWLWQINDIQAQGVAASPQDHPLKGAGLPTMFYSQDTKFKLALMSSTIPSESLLKDMLEKGIAVLNVGGDTGSLPTYYSIADPNSASINKNLENLINLKTITLAPSLTEIINPVNLKPSKIYEEGVLLQTNYASIWKDTNGEEYFAPALKTQMIRSSATGNLVYVTGLDKFNKPSTFHHQILRYDDFATNEELMPIYENPHSEGGASRGGCAG